MVTVTITSKNLSEGIKYNPFDKMVINKTKKVNFLAETLAKEVMDGPRVKKRLKKLKKLQKGFVSLLGAFTMMSPLNAFAQTPGLENPFATQTLPTITPNIILEYGQTIALLVVASGAAIALVLMGVAGIYRMFRKRDLAMEWSEDIIKGLVHVLVSIPVVFALYYLAQMVFGNLPFLNGLF